MSRGRARREPTEHRPKKRIFRFWLPPECSCGKSANYWTCVQRFPIVRRASWVDGKAGEFYPIRQAFVTRGQAYRSNGGHGANR